ncbi:RTA1-domain-containing protein [Cryphonectria parasitica EP155]|uniref:RTA1-domain-containing protein n=1 Tax=Cryphonectria parasitica (strain ATCC 38755 / EP155) TaxID=660469 RepID=A0A9P4YBB6_CRYP1|nr:RTA1-domain-containing protein [Cryphonectria parasitica EP155]KAF3769900.1 RTA1-domain-containing protein [Cryphonectria parasitica EP155]
MASLAGGVTNWYAYEPVTAAAVAATALFALTMIAHAFQMVRHKAWIWIVMVVAVAMECFGYGIRIASSKDTSKKPPFVAQYVLIVLAPVLMTGIIYVVFGRIVFHVVPAEHRSTKLLWVPPRWCTPIFVGFDIAALFLQLVGAVMIAGTSITDPNYVQKVHRGKDIALAGVSVQILAFGLFSIIAVRFHIIAKRFKADVQKRLQPIPGEKYVTVEGIDGRKLKPHWEVLLYVVNISCALIMVRTIYREIAFAEGRGGYPSKREWVQYVFDTIPMFFLTVIFCFTPPGRYVQMSFKQKKGQARVASSHGSDIEAHALQSVPK